ncbi:unnamed protein product [Protopolystoma xenopodis]|uniref:Uncharacterized protein n=1 Tax=Protopolystoma xenopodis TaxID=117903 RepID=A0A3S5FGH7_9PLAT|nr:unnamed protein product [Protopolystoma xenopodis]
MAKLTNDADYDAGETIFGFVALKQNSSENMCHLFCDKPEMPAAFIADYIMRYLLGISILIGTYHRPLNANSLIKPSFKNENGRLGRAAKILTGFRLPFLDESHFSSGGLDIKLNRVSSFYLLPSSHTELVFGPQPPQQLFQLRLVATFGRDF